ncbi:MAG: SGNH/GDSL hydrolase family protein [Planctomycetes bacterium]|nr:SGNH/GDSL hydrolase family protein [Planctomycetota bacterium]
MATIFREPIEWCDIWIRSAEKSGHPRCLCIGDSITRGYYGGVDQRLMDRFESARLATSRFLTDPVYHQELALVMEQYRFQVIHFNNGLHGWDFSEADYEDGLHRLVDLLRRVQPSARLICATSTPVRVAGDSSRFDARHERVVARNRLLTGVMSAQRIPINDLFSLALARPDWSADDGIHFNAAGCAGLAEAVAAAIASRHADR